MKRLKTIMVPLAIVSMVCASALFAQQRERLPGQSPSAPASRPNAQEPSALKSTTPEPPPVPKASTFIGSSVMNSQGESLGKIDDLVIDPATGRITYAALSHGSVLGLGGKLFAVAWEALKLQPDGKTFVLDVPKETLESASGFDKNSWPKQPDPTLSASARGTGTEMKPSAEAGAGSSMGIKPSTETASGSGLTGISATVQEVNAQGETITLKTEKGERVELQAPAAMLGGLQAGDAVEVKMVGTRATEIRKK
jgi:sporulation protein YlmC with PRC-barrel domain